MNLHEYQGKDILASFGVGVQQGIVANNKAEAVRPASAPVRWLGNAIRPSPRCQNEQG